MVEDPQSSDDHPAGDQPIVPDYGGACVTNVMPALLEPPDSRPPWLPAVVEGAEQVLFLVLDGLGWDQLVDRALLAPTMSAMAGGPILTVAPSTTSTAMTSITTGMTPGRHGIVGYRMAVEGQVLNVLRWSVAGRDQRSAIVPEKLQPTRAFLGHRPPVVTRAEFRSSGFTAAHLDGVRFSGYRVTSTLVAEARRLLGAGEPFVYAYYEGVDKVAHEFGLALHYDTELTHADRLVSDLIEVLPPRAALVVTADHGQVNVGDNMITPDREVLDLVSFQSGEGRFRWLHARGGRAGALLDAARSCHGSQAWVVARDEIVDGGWLGPEVSDEARGRLGDVALVARGGVAFADPDDSGPFALVSRHGSLTSAEMRVPLLAHLA